MVGTHKFIPHYTYKQFTYNNYFAVVYYINPIYIACVVNFLKVS